MSKNDLIQKAKSVTEKMVKIGYWSKSKSFQFETWEKTDLKSFIELYEK